MEVRKLEVTKEMQRDGILNSFSIPETGAMKCGEITIHEFSNHYEVILQKEKEITQIDLSNVLFMFVDSSCFTKTKYILLGKNHKIYFEKKEDFDIIFQKLNVIFKRK